VPAELIAAAPAVPLAASPASPAAFRRVTEDAPWVRRLLISGALLFLAAFLLVPAAAVIWESLRGGFELWIKAVTEPDAWAAIRLTLLVAAISVPLNTAFGLAAAWSLTRFRYRGQALFLSLIDLPFAVSPVIAGMVVILLFGAHGVLGAWCQEHGIRIAFAVPGIVLATVFVTFPFVARELIPFMQQQGSEEEQAALVMGASGWQIFSRVTLPNIRWSLLYGVILCNARAMGEFGAVSVVSGHIRGLTNTIPLHVEILYNEYAFRAAFAVASLLFLLALVTLVAKQVLERAQQREQRSAESGT
jgi:sulfate transport system permease protein